MIVSTSHMLDDAWPIACQAGPRAAAGGEALADAASGDATTRAIMANTIPSLWVPHEVKAGETLREVARKYRYDNPGPIVAFNCDRLPGAIEKWGGPRPWNPESIKAHSRKNKLNHALGVVGAIDPDSVPDYLPLESNQINSRAVLADHAGWEYGDVLTIVSEYPIDASLSPKDVAYLEIPWSPDAIAEFVALQSSHRKQIIVDTKKLIKEQSSDLSDLREVLFWVDFCSSMLMLGKDYVKLVQYQASKGSTMATLLKKALWVHAKKAGRSVSWGVKGWGQADGELPELTLPKKLKLKKGLGFWINNTIGWVSPSKWTSAYAALQEGDPDILWHGEAAVDVKTKNKIIDRARARITWIDEQVAWAKRASSRSFYKHVVQDKIQ